MSVVVGAPHGWGQFYSEFGIAAQFRSNSGIGNWNWNWNWWDWKRPPIYIVNIEQKSVSWADNFLMVAIRRWNYIFFHENCFIVIKISLNYIANGPNRWLSARLQ